jgi:hypothetical protein
VNSAANAARICRNAMQAGDFAVPDILVRDIEESVAERIKAIARERQWTINEVILHAIKQSLGFAGEDIFHREMQDIAVLSGTWDQKETAAFRSAVEAFEKRDEHSLFPDAPPTPDQPPK